MTWESRLRGVLHKQKKLWIPLSRFCWGFETSNWLEDCGLGCPRSGNALCCWKGSQMSSYRLLHLYDPLRGRIGKRSGCLTWRGGKLVCERDLFMILLLNRKGGWVPKYKYFWKIYYFRLLQYFGFYTVLIEDTTYLKCVKIEIKSHWKTQ